ncbi:MAG TPA: carboxypeptidase regulatory-like domain-containing protein [Planctomycetes bacterium]|nr:carboxypeptidase regulatory-like domain-containing protein [Planctomycetota bacterium]
MRSRTVLPPLVVLAVAAVLALLQRGSLRRLEAERPSAEPLPTQSSDLAPPPPPLDAPVPGDEPERVALPSASIEREPPRAPTTSSSVPQSFLEIRLRVLDVEGHPLSGVPLRSGDLTGEATANSEWVSDEAGEVLLRLPAGSSAEVVVDSRAGPPRFATVRSTRVSGASQAPFVIAAPGIRLAGRVQDPAGIAISGAELTLPVREWRLPRFPLPLDDTLPPRFETQTDDEGSFSLGVVPYLAEKEFFCSAPGFQGVWTPLPSRDAEDLRITLPEDEQRDGVTVTGTVLLPSGAPAAGARVSFCGVGTRTDTDGVFLLQVGVDAIESEPLAAGLHGYGPAIVSGFGERVRARLPLSPEPVTLILTEEHTISGRVVDAEGSPLAGWIVEVRDPTALTEGMVPVESAEALAAAPKTMSAADGGFVLRGLSDRPYRVWAYDQASLRAVEAPAPVPADTRDLLLSEGPRDVLPRVEGVVLSWGEVPLAGLDVAIERVIASGNSGWTSMSAGGTSTGSDGRFVLHDVPTHDISIVVRGDGVMPASFGVSQRPEEGELRLDPSTPLTLHVEARCHLRVTLLDDSGSASFQVLDEDGTPLTLYRFQANGSLSTPSWSVDAGTPSPMLAVSERAREIVLTGDSGKVLTQPLFLDPTQPTELELHLP